jgi:hypothetical protein
VARVGEKRDTSKVFVGKCERRRALENLGIDSSIILKWICMK